MKTWRLLSILAVLLAALLIGGYLLHSRRATVTAPAPVWTPVSTQRLSHGRFENFTVYMPHASPRGFVLLMSGADGWTAAMDRMARQLAEQGALVAGLDVAQFNAALEKDGGQCVYPDGDLENLSRFVQAYFRLPTYLSPILGGYAAGGTLAYATLVQAPKSTFAGAVSVDFCPSYDLVKPLCKGSGIEFSPQPSGTGVDFLPSKQTGNSWAVVQTDTHQACDPATVRNFVVQVPGAQFTSVTTPNGNAATGDGAAPEGAAPGAGVRQVATAFETLMAQHPAAAAAVVPSVLSDLPIVTVPATPGTTQNNTFAIVLSGDGGWAGLDKDVAAALSASGIPVIGLDSLRYFWSPRTPASLAADLDRMTRYYLQQLGKQRVLLIGYSQGADVLPFAVNRLSDVTRAHVGLTAVMGMSEHALFEFHVSSWISDDDSGPATLPEVDKITGIPVLCIYGEEETDTLCPKLDPHKATIVKLKGGHHFDGDYANLARIILSSAAPH